MTGAKPDLTGSAFEALEEALASRDMSIDLDLRRVCHPSCPLPFDNLKTRIAYLYLALLIALGAGLAWLRVDKMYLWGGLAAFTAVYWVALRPFAEQRFVRNRIVSYVMEDPDRLAKLWRYGGLSLVAADGRRATAPKDDWRTFVLAKD